MFGSEYLSSYSSFSSKSKGRLFNEEIREERSEFQRDRDRIIHSAAFRRLEYKTQVFLYNEGDHYRTRLTHSIEVAQLGRSLARIFKVDEDLTETICLAHDLGHTPFGHAGEYALQDCMESFGCFDHNAQALRIVTKLERKYLDFEGLNLSWESLEGLAKHNGPVANPPRALKEFNDVFDLQLNSYASLEAQIAAISDDIAYNSHDIEDGIRAGLFQLEDLLELPCIGEIVAEYLDKYKGVENSIIVNEIRSKFIKVMLKDLVENTKHNLSKINPKTVEDVRGANIQVVDFSENFFASIKVIKRFLFDRMYRHHKVLIMTNKAKRIVSSLFEFYLANPDCLPEIWKLNIDLNEREQVAIRVADFIAGMTDRYAFRQYNKIFDTSETVM